MGKDNEDSPITKSGAFFNDLYHRFILTPKTGKYFSLTFPIFSRFLQSKTLFSLQNSFSDFSSVCSDQRYISDLEDECKSFSYDLSNGSPIDINNFNIVHFNINSITAEGRLDQLSDICRILNLDVRICILKTKALRLTKFKVLKQKTA